MRLLLLGKEIAERIIIMNYSYKKMNPMKVFICGTYITRGVNGLEERSNRRRK